MSKKRQKKARRFSQFDSAEYNPRQAEMIIFSLEQRINLIRSKYSVLAKDYVELGSYHIQAESNDVINQIEEEFFLNKNGLILFDDIAPLSKREDFLDLIYKAKIRFSSIKNKELADVLCQTILYLANKRDSIGSLGHDIGREMKNSADKFAESLGVVFTELDERGYNSLKAKADELNRLEIKTARDKKWTKTAVKNTYKRWQKLKEEENKKSNSPKP